MEPMIENSRRLQVLPATPSHASYCRRADADLGTDVIEAKIDRRELWVAEESGRPVGYLRLEFLWSKLPYIGLIRVEPARRRRGVGKEMLLALEKELSSRGHDQIFSSSQADEPEPQAWHRKQGFQECGFFAGLNRHGIGEIFFRKAIPPGSRPEGEAAAVSGW